MTSSSSPSLTPLEQTFLDLAAIDEVYPHEHEVLTYVKRRLDAAGVSYRQDGARNIIAQIPGGPEMPVALVAHTDIAAPLAGRQIVVEPDRIKTDGTGLLGADDKAAVAILLELADDARTAKLARPVELVFTVGEETGCVGAAQLDTSSLTARGALVLDWMGPINHLVTQSPAYGKIDVQYLGRDAHPAEWREGKNAGMALVQAATGLPVGEYEPGVTLNIGIFQFGNARNKVPGEASLQAEMRSYNTAHLKRALGKVEQHFQTVARQHDITAQCQIVVDSPAYQLDQSGRLLDRLKHGFAQRHHHIVFESTYGCFDGNILASRGLEVIMLGAGYYNPHSHGEYLNRTEFAEAFALVKDFCLT